MEYASEIRSRHSAMPSLCVATSMSCREIEDRGEVPVCVRVSVSGEAVHKKNRYIRPSRSEFILSLVVIPSVVLIFSVRTSQGERFVRFSR